MQTAQKEIMKIKEKINEIENGKMVEKNQWKQKLLMWKTNKTEKTR